MLYGLLYAEGAADAAFALPPGRVSLTGLVGTTPTPRSIRVRP